jgi:hypothetical protein
VFLAHNLYSQKSPGVRKANEMKTGEFDRYIEAENRIATSICNRTCCVFVCRFGFFSDGCTVVRISVSKMCLSLNILCMCFVGESFNWKLQLRKM